jgi:hypothetical protein
MGILGVDVDFLPAAARGMATRAPPSTYGQRLAMTLRLGELLQRGASFLCGRSLQERAEAFQELAD